METEAFTERKKESSLQRSDRCDRRNSALTRNHDCPISSHQRYADRIVTHELFLTHLEISKTPQMEVHHSRFSNSHAFWKRNAARTVSRRRNARALTASRVTASTTKLHRTREVKKPQIHLSWRFLISFQNPLMKQQLISFQKQQRWVSSVRCAIPTPVRAQSPRPHTHTQPAARLIN